jgi:hypothetical protein
MTRVAGHRYCDRCNKHIDDAELTFFMWRWHYCIRCAAHLLLHEPPFDDPIHLKWRFEDLKEGPMKLDGIAICDFCTGVIFPDEGTPIHLQVGEKKFTFNYHNRNANDCLKQKIEQLRQQFAAQK